MALLRNMLRSRTEERASSPISFTDWHKMFRPGGQLSYGGQQYQAYTLAGESQGGYYYDRNSVVFACEMNRLLLFSEARFQWQQLVKGRPGDLFGNATLGVLEEPWAGATTRDLLVQAELDIAEHGNSYWVRDGAYLHRLDPCRVRLLTTGEAQGFGWGAVGDELVQYLYEIRKNEWVAYFPEDVAHYKPIPNRDNRFLGMSWLTPCLEDVVADEEMTTHKVSQLRNRGNLDLVINIDKTVTAEQFKAVVDSYEAKHMGPQNAGKPLFITGGVDVKTVGQTFEQMSIRATQGAGETRIAACAGVPPVIVGLSEGLGAATYSNYAQARRRLSDGTMRPLWGAFAGALQSIVKPPAGARLWYDDRDIPWVREDIKDQAEIRQIHASTIRQLIDAGYKPDSVVDAVTSGDFTRLEHTDLFSVQLQPAGAAPPALNPAPTE